MKASNRQKKLLTFFNVPFSNRITSGAAGWEIADLMASEKCLERWRKYLYLTGDFDSDTDELKPFDPQALEATVVPDEWRASAALDQFRNELVAHEMADGSPFDAPQPEVIFQSRCFMFTGKFSFGSRKACQAAVIERGGITPSNNKSVSHQINYLVVGTEGSTQWKRGAYGNKIEAAILARREYGNPAIISEAHWASHLKMNTCTSVTEATESNLHPTNKKTHQYASLNEACELNKAKLVELGWHVKIEEAFFSLHRKFKNGTPIKGADVSLNYEEYAYDLVIDEDGEEHKENVRLRTRPWVVRTKQMQTATYGELDRAVSLFLEQANKIAPINNI